jgi:hypothetical protein
VARSVKVGVEDGQGHNSGVDEGGWSGLGFKSGDEGEVRVRVQEWRGRSRLGLRMGHNSGVDEVRVGFQEWR